MKVHIDPEFIRINDLVNILHDNETKLEHHRKCYIAFFSGKLCPDATNYHFLNNTDSKDVKRLIIKHAFPDINMLC